MTDWVLPWWCALLAALLAAVAAALAYRRSRDQEPAAAPVEELVRTRENLLVERSRTKRLESELRMVARNARCFLWYSTVEDRGGEFEWNLRIFTEELDAFVHIEDLPPTSKARVWYFGRLQEELIRLGDTAREAMKSGKPGYTQEFRCKDESGQEVWFAEDVTVEVVSPTLWNLVGVSTDITDRKRAEAERERLVLELQKALSEVKQLSGMLPICSSCKKVRDDAGYWRQIEVYIHSRSEVQFSHGLCPDCKDRLYPGIEV
jgi:PAS domain-containing protein